MRTPPPTTRGERRRAYREALAELHASREVREVCGQVVAVCRGHDVAWLEEWYRLVGRFPDPAVWMAWDPWDEQLPFAGLPLAEGDTMPLERFGWQSANHVVMAAPVPNQHMLYLTMKRFDKDVMGDWRVKQRIKNAILGPEAEAIELYPAESRLLDQANQYHMWAVLPPHRFPFGQGRRSVVDGDGKSARGEGRQRPLDNDGGPL